MGPSLKSEALLDTVARVLVPLKKRVGVSKGNYSTLIGDRYIVRDLLPLLTTHNFGQRI
jgi:hypothetical protein